MTLRHGLILAPLALIAARAAVLAAPRAEASASDTLAATDAAVKSEAPAAAPAGADSTPAPPPPRAAPSGDNIVVTGERPRGSVIGDIPATQTYNKSDVMATGASTVGELLDALAQQSASEQGRRENKPVVLVNGKRVAGIEDVSQIPAEAIKRVEIFPEELALKYGYRADQKVVNVVLMDTFNVAKGNASFGAPTEGGYASAGVGVNYLRINFDNRVTLSATYGHSSSLLESERDVSAAAGRRDARTIPHAHPRKRRPCAEWVV